MKFISIIKPGIIFGNIITVTGGFFLGCQGDFNFKLFLMTLVGMCFVIASGCVFNNYLDRDIDKLMERTKKRITAQGLISGKVAYFYATILGLLGLSLLYVETNVLTVIISFIGLFVYVVAYTILSKRQTIYGTLVGGIAGAVPPVVGYTAVTNQFDMGAILLFLILFLWQLPHFYAISIYRLNDYRAASIPILPVVKDILYTKISMVIYIIPFTIASILPTLFGYVGKIYFVMALVLGVTWFILGIQGFNAKNDLIWARKMFAFSILAITILSFMMAVKQ